MSKEIIIKDDGFTRDILIYAFRYAIARRSYAVSLFINWAKLNINLFNDSDKDLMIKEINQALIDYQGYLDYSDMNTWIKFKDFLKDNKWEMN